MRTPTAKAVPTWLWVLLVAAGAYFGRDLLAARDRAGLLAQLRVQQQLNDSTAAILAKTRVDKEALGASLVAAEELNGKLVAAVRLKVARRDTVVRHDTLVTTQMTDSTRVAHFRDSTFAGVLDGTVTAPPYPAALGLQYTLTRPEFTPEIGFVEVDGRHVATVTWQGEQVEVEAPFMRPTPPKPKKEKPWYPFAEVGLGNNGVLVKTGMKLQFFANYSVVTSVERAGGDARWGLTLRRDFK